MTIFSIVEKMNCIFPACCSREPKKKNADDHDAKMIEVSEKYNIAILPVVSDYKIENLYPVTDQVHKWNILIVGNDKTYIHASIYDLDIPSKILENNLGARVLCSELNEFFDPIFDKTLQGRKLQFLIIWRKTTYMVNTYPLQNTSDNVVGAIMFVRAYELLPKMALEMCPKTPLASSITAL